MPCAIASRIFVPTCRIGRSIVREAYSPSVNAAATDGARSTVSMISTLSETWMGIRKTLAETATANRTVSSHAAARGLISIHVWQKLPSHLAHVAIVGAAGGVAQRSLLEWNGDQQIEAAGHREHEPRHRHVRNGEDHQEPAEVDRMTDPLVWPGGFELGQIWRVLPDPPDLPNASKLQQIDRHRAAGGKPDAGQLSRTQRPCGRRLIHSPRGARNRLPPRTHSHKQHARDPDVHRAFERADDPRKALTNPVAREDAVV